jgi:N-acetylmuramic acid 6-phosphate etherase
VGQQQHILALEAGGTKTTALLADHNGRLLDRRQFGPLNLKLTTDTQLLAAFRRCNSEISNLQSPIATVVLCLAGCRTHADRARLRALAARIWPRAAIIAGNDLDSGLAAAFGANGAGILVLSGTGSVVVGRNARGQLARAGGWGHLLGDHGSGYDLALANLKSEIARFDHTGKITTSLRAVLRRLCLNSPEQLLDWIHRANKNDIAALLPDLINANRRHLDRAAALLAADCAAVAKKLRLAAPDIALAGGVLRNRPPFRRAVLRAIRATLPRASVRLLKTDTALGALALAPREGRGDPPGRPLSTARHVADEPSARPYRPAKILPLTEQRNPRTLDLDRRNIPELIATMLDEESRVVPAIRKAAPSIERAIRAIVAALRRGGRLFYVGAGTSGRLGVLDASECPPTFSVAPETVQGIMAGGVNALHSSVEAAEDDPRAGAEAIQHRATGKRDVVVGIAASGRTPFVLGALDEAKRRGAKTFLLSFSPPRTARHAPITVLTGPEVLTGSTRLKAGTATKLVLNMLTTVSMVRLGKVVSNLMVDVKPTNDKLRARARRIVATLRGCDEAEARRRLVAAGWNVKKAALS